MQNCRPSCYSDRRNRHHSALVSKSERTGHPPAPKSLGTEKHLKGSPSKPPYPPRGKSLLLTQSSQWAILSYVEPSDFPKPLAVRPQKAGLNKPGIGDRELPQLARRE